MRKMFFVALCLATSLMQAGAVANVQQSYMAGARPILIPAPEAGLVEIGAGYRPIMEVFVPSANRLLAAFVPPDFIATAKSGKTPPLRKYALVETVRAAEYLECGPNEFKQVVDNALQQFGNAVTGPSKDAEEAELNRRMRQFVGSNGKLSIGQPMQLGATFSKQNAYGFSMIVPVSGAGITQTMGAETVIMRAKNRLLFLYMYAEYKDASTMTALHNAVERWADSVLKANGE